MPSSDFQLLPDEVEAVAPLLRNLGVWGLGFRYENNARVCFSSDQLSNQKQEHAEVSMSRRL